MSVYVIAVINISDRDEYARYEQGFMEIFNQYKGRMLSVDEAPALIEGRWPHTRTVLVEFPDRAEFDRWYHSEAYQTLAKHRFKASEGSIALLQGLPASAP